jgi:hypothetical protein
MQLYDKAAGCWIPFELWPKQIESLHLIHTEKKIIILKKRQVGATQLVMADSLVQAMTQSNFDTLFLSVGQFEANEALSRPKEMYNQLPEDVRKGIKVEMTATEIFFPANNSRILSLTASNGRSLTANRVVLDEAAYYTPRDAHITLTDVLKSVSPVIEKAGGQMIIISTANGMGMYRDMYYAAKIGKSSYRHLFYSCWDDPTFTPEKRAQLVADYGEDAVNQEHPRTDTEAFLFSGRARFDLRKLSEKVPANPIKIGMFAENNGRIAFREDKGPVKIFVPKKANGTYMITADVAEGLAHGDYSCAKVFDIETREQVAEWHGHCEPMEFGRIMAMLGRAYNNALLIPEVNNHGHSVVAQIVHHEQYPLQQIFIGRFLRVKGDDEYKDPVKRYGWVTTGKTKPLIIDKLAQFIVANMIPIMSDEDITELSNYIVDDAGNTEAQQGGFDDRVMALAIALQMYELTPIIRQTKEYQGPEEYRMSSDMGY